MSRPKTKPLTYQLEKDNNFITKVSTNTTQEKPNIVFLRAKVKITPIENKKTYIDEILSLKNEFDTFVRNLFDNCKYYENNYIFSLDVAEKSVKYKKTSHLKYDLFVKPKTQLTLEKHKEIFKKLSDTMDDKLIEIFKKYKIQWK